MEPYVERDINFLGITCHEEWRLKTWSVSLPGRKFDHEDFRNGFEKALGGLPQPAIQPGRLGVGFLIGHRGKTGDYVVLCWWDNENELPIRLHIRRSAAEPWRPATGTESICVWDLSIIWRERDAYVQTIMSGAGPAAVDAYLEQVAAV